MTEKCNCESCQSADIITAEIEKLGLDKGMFALGMIITDMVFDQLIEEGTKEGQDMAEVRLSDVQQRVEKLLSSFIDGSRAEVRRQHSSNMMNRLLQMLRESGMDVEVGDVHEMTEDEMADLRGKMH